MMAVPNRRPCILVADDDEGMLAALTEWLRQNGYDVVSADHGRSALEVCARGLPDLILLDVSMPFLDGCETCRRIRQTPEGAKVPIIMMTGLCDDRSVDQAFVAGADDYVTKPIHWAVLRQRIRLFMERRQTEETIRHQATFDGLTDLPNRTLFLDRLDHSLSLAHRKQENLAVMFIDLDRFKEVNDTLGHTAGDELLRQVAVRLRQCVRNSDTVARMGGDEFTIILASLTVPMDPETVARKILAALYQPFDLFGTRVVVSGSVGISLFPQDAESLDLLLKWADHAMYAAKRRGRNCFVFFNDRRGKIENA
ncbi:MAG: diguanylate cyclase [Magnetococcales bacterium]|nr:diguanylate cyclase [Magnetococcales bacterium]